MPEISVVLPQSAKAELNRKIDSWRSKAGNMTTPFKRFGVYMTRTTDKAFKQKGRPAGSWTPLAEATRAIKESKGQNPDMPLIAGGDLMKSFTPVAGGKGFVFGTADKRASRHQFGGQVMFKGAMREVPARPMINWLPKDEAELEKIVEDYIGELR